MLCRIGDAGMRLFTYLPCVTLVQVSREAAAGGGGGSGGGEGVPSGAASRAAKALGQEREAHRRPAVLPLFHPQDDAPRTARGDKPIPSPSQSAGDAVASLEAEPGASPAPAREGHRRSAHVAGDDTVPTVVSPPAAAP